MGILPAVSDEVGTTPAGARPVIDRDGQHDAGALGLVAWITDVGHGRKRNEDRLLVKDAFDGRFLLLIVADGAGGHDRGDKAATTVVETLDEVFPAAGDCPDGPPIAWLESVIMTAHARVEGLASGENRPPASTLVGLLVERETLCAWRFHVGDSRLYGRRPGGSVLAWTRDHNITNGLIDRGLPAAQAAKIAEGGKLTQVMGGANTPEPEIRGPFQLAAGDSFLLCSDGVYGYNADRDPIAPALDPETGDSLARANALKAAVLAGDALDNLTAVVWDLPPDAAPLRKRLGLVEPYDRQDVSTMLGLPSHPVGEGTKRTGPPPPESMPGMPGVTDADIAARRGPSADDLEAARAKIEEAAAHAGPSNPGLKFGMLLMATLAILAALVLLRTSGDPNEPMSEAELEAERAAARALAGMPPEGTEPGTPTVEVPAPPPVPRPPTVGANPVEAALARLVGGFDGTWWNTLSPEQQQERMATLRELLGPRAAESVELTWSEGTPPVERRSSRGSWPAPGGANADLAADAWSARGRVLGLYGGLAGQPGVDEALRKAACSQLMIRWPRYQGPPPDAVQLPSWIGGCLPSDAEGASVSVRLGRYPESGWLDEDWTELATLADSPGGAASVTRFDVNDWNPRLVELGHLALALGRSPVEGLQVEVKVALAPGDPQALATLRAEQAAKLLSEGAEGRVRVSAVGTVGEPLVPVEDSLTPEQSAARDALERRVEITLFRATQLELDTDDGADPAPTGTTPPAATPGGE